MNFLRILQITLFTTILSFGIEGLDSIRSDTTEKQPVNYLAPAVQTLGVNILMASFNRYIARAEYAYISFSSVKDNFRHGWVWDDDNFNVNQIGHPLQGGFYYTAARFYGHNYFQALTYSGLGSLQWEYFMETEYPAINDLITTTLGGAMLGEITYRLSDQILDENTYGAKRVIREFGAALVCPIKGLNRLLNGSRRDYSATAENRKKYPLKMKFSMGTRILLKLTTDELNPRLNTTSANSNTNLSLEHGDINKSKKPYDYFFLNFGFSFMLSQNMHILSVGQLWGHKIPVSQKVKSTVGVMQNFEFINSNIYKLALSGFGIQLNFLQPFFRNYSFSLHGEALGIALGAVGTEYYLNVERDYNFGPGAGLKGGLMIQKHMFGRLYFNYNRYMIYTFSGAEGREIIGMGRAEILKTFYKTFGISVAYIFYDRKGRYDEFEDIDLFDHELKLELTYAIFRP